MNRRFIKKPIEIEAFRYCFDVEPEWSEHVTAGRGQPYLIHPWWKELSEGYTRTLAIT